MILMKYHTFFCRKQGKMSQNLSSAAVVIGALRVTSISQFNSGRLLLIQGIVFVGPII